MGFLKKNNDSTVDLSFYLRYRYKTLTSLFSTLSIKVDRF
jgi:hypothetical protein